MNVSKLFDVSDKVIMITGATGNLGREYVKGFSQAGANVVIADLQFKNCKKLSDEINSLRNISINNDEHFDGEEEVKSESIK